MSLSFSSEQAAKTFFRMSLGDSYGVPLENISPKRFIVDFKTPYHLKKIERIKYSVSDDTDHALFTCRALSRAKNPNDFSQYLTWYLRLWLLTLPPGIGLGTLQAILKHWLFFIPKKWSSSRSGGNGPLMRAPVIGAEAFDIETLVSYVDASTYITHRNPECRDAALLVAIATRYFWTKQESADFENFRESLKNPAIHFASPKSTEELLAEIGSRLKNKNEPEPNEVLFKKGVSGYAPHTALVSLYFAFQRRESVATCLTKILKLGGDTDTTAAVYCGITASRADAWLDRKSNRFFLLNRSLADVQKLQSPLPVLLPFMLIRNLLMLPWMIFALLWRRFATL